MTSERDQDAKDLAEAYRRVDDASAAFYQAMEAAMPLFIAFVEARKERAKLREQYRAKMQGLKLQLTKTE